MAALSPRSINIQVKQKSRPKEMVDDATQKAEAARKVQKEKEYAPPPPEWVIQPPISNGALAEKFKTGRLLGKGGFAICYEGELRNRRAGPNNKTVFALKVVRSRMSQKKMEDKVMALAPMNRREMLTKGVVLVPYRAANTCQNATSKHRRVLQSIHLQRKHVCCFGALLQWFGNGDGEEEEMSQSARSPTIHRPDLRCDEVYAC